MFFGSHVTFAEGQTRTKGRARAFRTRQATASSLEELSCKLPTKCSSWFALIYHATISALLCSAQL